jgi:hypothetical protein
VVARLSPYATVDDARREIEAIASAPEFDAWRRDGRHIGLVSLRDDIMGDRAYALSSSSSLPPSCSRWRVRIWRAAARTLGRAPQGVRDAQSDCSQAAGYSSWR